MLKRLSYSVTFPTTGRSLAADVEFHKGLGVITGPNGSGKSSHVEMIRFCLFGSAALRGRADDYKTLKAELEFSAKGEDYRVVRTGSSARLYRGDTELAVGVRPVNEKIPQILGFGLEVFDVACIANQGDIEKLGSMKPAERKRMVDSVIGVSLIDDLARWAGEEALALGRQAEAVERTLVAPAEPEKPDNYLPSHELETKLADLGQKQQRLSELEGWLSHGRSEPVKPKEPINLPASALKMLVDKRAEVETRLKVYEAELSTLPPPAHYSDEEIDRMEKKVAAWELWQERQNWLRRNPAPEYSVEQLDVFAEDWALIDKIEERDRLLARIHHLETCGTHECPQCGHEWYAEENQIDALRAQLDGIGDVPVSHEQPPIPRHMIASARDHAANWAIPQHLVGAVEVPSPKVTRQEIMTYRAAVAKADRRRELEIAIDRLRPQLKGVDLREKYQQRLEYELGLQRYQTDMVEYQRWLAEKQLKQTQAEQLRVDLWPLETVRVWLKQAVLYEQQLEQYGRAKTEYDRNSEIARTYRSQADDWKRGKAALARLRVLIKQHLLPSLNKVASKLIDQMTGGDLTTIVVDDDFEVVVDGQPLATLSGSGKAVSNLALRIGLGQVLTNNVLSLFIGDEIDASFDSSRAEKTAATLRTIVDFVSQIILVTHKSPVADYTIDLG